MRNSAWRFGFRLILKWQVTHRSCKCKQAPWEGRKHHHKSSKSQITNPTKKKGARHHARMTVWWWMKDVRSSWIDWKGARFLDTEYWRGEGTCNFTKISIHDTSKSWCGGRFQKWRFCVILIRVHSRTIYYSMFKAFPTCSKAWLVTFLMLDTRFVEQRADDSSLNRPFKMPNAQTRLVLHISRTYTLLFRTQCQWSTSMCLFLRKNFSVVSCIWCSRGLGAITYGGHYQIKV